MKYCANLIFILLFIHTNNSVAQKILTLTKPGIINRIRYYENNEISFKLKGEHIVHTGNITQLNDSSFLLNNMYPVRVDAIRMIIDYKKGRWARFFHRLLLTGGIFYYAVGTANRIIIHYPVFEKNFLITSAGITGSSFLFTPFTSRRYRINKYRYLKVIDVTIQPG
jgi:hypothetical protein